LVENPLGVFQYIPVVGRQQLDMSARVTVVDVTTLNPADSLGTPRVFAGLPIETVDERTVVLKPTGGGPILRGQTGFVLMPGLRGAYSGHRIEFSGYELDATASDPNRLVVTICTATSLERQSRIGGRSFPLPCGSVFCVRIEDALSSPVAFTSPVNLTVQYKKRSDPAQGDVLSFGCRPGVEEAMAIVYDTEVEDPVDFGFCTSSTQTLDVNQKTVSINGLVGLTGADGLGTWGAVCRNALAPAAHWHLYR
jgi:hypothetical protein